ncbi:MAG TPA: alanine--tRNA ligase-related protein [Candidatus Saccharimonadales bacterium]|nr:alanine--tRNA ligase-related protein [Candidatus Saccharimonadales bacterium]
MTAKQIIDIYLSFFEKRGHKRIAGAPLVPDNDPTTLFTSSGMQPLIPYLLGEQHPMGTRLIDVQNCFRAVDIDEVGDNRHTTFFRMLGNWSLGDYFKPEQISWVWELYTKELHLPPEKLYVSVFSGYEDINEDNEALKLWTEIFMKEGLDPKKHIFKYGVGKNWWSRSGTPDKMPTGEPGGPDSEIFYDFGDELHLHENSQWKNEVCHPNCDCGRYWEIGNSVFMQYVKQEDGSFKELPKLNVDFGGGVERLIGATENQPDMFMTSLFKLTIESIEKETGIAYKGHEKHMQIIADHLGGSIFMVGAGILPANKERGYILRRHLRRSFDHLWDLKKDANIEPILETIFEQYKDTNPEIIEKFEQIKLIILTEKQGYERTLVSAKRLIEKDLQKQGHPELVSGAQGSGPARMTVEELPGVKEGDELMGVVEISSETAFKAISSFGLSPTQLKSLGYSFNNQELAEKIKEHQNLSRTASVGKFKGGLADAQELTVKGHSATHLLHQAIRDMLGTDVHQTGSNITAERLRFDFNYDKKLTDEQIMQLEKTVNEKIKEDLPVRFEMMPIERAKEIGAIGLFNEKYAENVKVYIMGGSGKEGDYGAYSKEFCGGPHVEHTGLITSFTITKQESLGQNQQRIYAVVS